GLWSRAAHDQPELFRISFRDEMRSHLPPSTRTDPVWATLTRRTRSNNASRPTCNPILCAIRIPGLPPSALLREVINLSRRTVLWAYGVANSGKRSQKIF